ncbi:MAG TPA: VOC family protein [Solirubrobacteraceae bacterium]|nr:VOC family protein [Solirubrobacteraceae bacterium]
MPASVFRPASVSYLRIPAPDPQAAAAFYAAVFGWSTDGHRFEDGSGHVIGHFMPDLPVAGDGGVRPYVYVEDVDATLQRALGHGAQTVEAPYPEGDLRVATIRDPAGNVIGIWQQGPRA